MVVVAGGGWSSEERARFVSSFRAVLPPPCVRAAPPRPPPPPPAHSKIAVGLTCPSPSLPKHKQTKQQHNKGRLAMIAMLGFAAQAVQTGTGPVQNLVDHLASPTGANLLQNLKNGVGGVL